MLRTLLLGLLAVSATASCKGTEGGPAVQAGVAAGKVVEISGTVTAKRGTDSRALTAGTEVSGDDVIETGADSAIKIVLAHNNATWSLGPNKREKVADSLAWGLAKVDTPAVGTVESTSAAGRHAEKAGANTGATVEETTRRESASVSPPAPGAPPAPVTAPAAPMADSKDSPPERDRRAPTPSGGGKPPSEEGKMGKSSGGSVGMSGTGEGGGGKGTGGLGNIGTLGKGSGTGTGQGYGAGADKTRRLDPSLETAQTPKPANDAVSPAAAVPPPPPPPPPGPGAKTSPQAAPVPEIEVLAGQQRDKLKGCLDKATPSLAVVLIIEKGKARFQLPSGTAPAISSCLAKLAAELKPSAGLTAKLDVTIK